jgi:integral membrane sensor domain MASE1
MRILSATEAVSPAIARTKLVLFKPFRLGRSWKLAATGYLSGTASMFLPFPLIYLVFIPIIWHKEAPGSVIAIVCAAVAAMMTIYVVIYYLCSRLRFAFLTSFSIVVSL